MALHAAGGEQIIFLPFHFSQKFGRIPTAGSLRQFTTVFPHRPSRGIGSSTARQQSTGSKQSFGQLARHHVGLAVLQFGHELSGVRAHFHTHGHSQLLGKFLTQQVLVAHTMPMVVIISVWPRQCDHNHLAIAHDVVEREVAGVHGCIANHSAPWRHCRRLLLLAGSE